MTKPDKDKKCRHHMGFGVDGLYRCQLCRKLPKTILIEKQQKGSGKCKK